MCVFCLAVPQVDGAKDESVFVPRKKPAHLHYSDEIVHSLLCIPLLLRRKVKMFR